MPPSPRSQLRKKEVRKSELDLDLLRALAQTEVHFSDDESDGVESDDDIDKLDVVFVPIITRWNEPKCRISPGKRKPTASPKKPATDDLEWTFVDKSPTFERIRRGKTSLSKSWH
ncbi:hypothetical protein THRCLA_22993 [Thraustotheca clavata]|uniref:Uncharacterized protein n=1 Tax=Thraustotheca clavata TaxID=74557 RepID=A0A1V9YJN1_9STRA|nr:hypothetical protein THRCLA_22993 [Thraustotheca clavata]